MMSDSETTDRKLLPEVPETLECNIKQRIPLIQGLCVNTYHSFEELDLQPTGQPHFYFALGLDC